MNFSQTKLSKSEWELIETPIPESEIIILSMIQNGMTNTSIRSNSFLSLLSYLNVSKSPEMENYLFETYFRSSLESIILSSSSIELETQLRCKFAMKSNSSNGNSKKSQPQFHLKKADLIRLEKNEFLKTFQFQSSMKEVIKEEEKQKKKGKKEKENKITTSSSSSSSSASHVETTSSFCAAAEDIRKTIFEFVLMDLAKQVVLIKEKEKEKDVVVAYYTLLQLMKNTISHVNRNVIEMCIILLSFYEPLITIKQMMKYSPFFLEHNTMLAKYKDRTLYEHQRRIFYEVTLPHPKLILYIAPTGTGKTLTPIGLSEKFKVIFVCAARHVGIALAQNAVSIHKRVAFAFGCVSAKDIRLHYFAAADYTINKRTGAIKKVDNSNGSKVDIMICDIHSYLIAQYYMLSFHQREKIITFWDEPTISMDYENHPLHELLQQVWDGNRIPNLVLSSATLPKEEDIPEVIQDFRIRFEDAEVITIMSHECNKSIPLIDQQGYSVLPHCLTSDYASMISSFSFCVRHPSLFRYLDVQSIVTSIFFLFSFYEQKQKEERQKARLFIKEEKETNTFVENEFNEEEKQEEEKEEEEKQEDDRELFFSFSSFIENPFFSSFQDLNLTSLKQCYFYLFCNQVQEEDWPIIYEQLQSIRRPFSIDSATGTYDFANKSVLSTGESPSFALNSTTLPQVSEQFGIFVTTSDAHTLTDGPTICLTDQIEQIAQFYLQTSQIPAIVTEDLMEKIEHNNTLSERIFELEKVIDDLTANMTDKSLAKSGDEDGSGGGGGGGGKEIENKTQKGTVIKAKQELEQLRSQIRKVNLNPTFVPNHKEHLLKWAPSSFQLFSSFSLSYSSDIDEASVVSIMSLHNVSASWKILLLLGIGIFSSLANPDYVDIMKTLAMKQKLYLILASSDYIYGTNYQFCHGYISKDLKNITQEKLIQSLGRIGRNSLQQTYSIRFRDPHFFSLLFSSPTISPEIQNMNKLFQSISSL